jgi:hypothetical protein
MSPGLLCEAEFDNEVLRLTFWNPNNFDMMDVDISIEGCTSVIGELAAGTHSASSAALNSHI